MSLRPVEAPALAEVAVIRHGFFTRRGGVSQGIWQGLNCGPGSADDDAHVAENRERVRAHLGAHALLSLHQIHSADVHVVDAPFAGARPRGDALVTRQPGLAIGVLTADCAPILFADPVARVVGAAHAGWKGALTGVAEATITAMEGQGARRADMVAAIGPCIGPDSYEVGPEFAEPFAAFHGDASAFFRPGPGDRLVFNLPAYVAMRLAAAGVAAFWTGHDTLPGEGDFFSYRRSRHRGEPDYGRQLSAIMLCPT